MCICVHSPSIYYINYSPGAPFINFFRKPRYYISHKSFRKQAVSVNFKAIKEIKEAILTELTYFSLAIFVKV